MSAGELPFFRSKTLGTLYEKSRKEETERIKFVRSKTIARSTFPQIMVPSRFKVFSRLRQRLDPMEKEMLIKKRLYLATLVGVLNLRRMELKASKSYEEVTKT